MYRPAAAPRDAEEYQYCAVGEGLWRTQEDHFWRFRDKPIKKIFQDFQSLIRFVLLTSMVD